jgi:hypothetical protein
VHHSVTLLRCGLLGKCLLCLLRCFLCLVEQSH